MSKGTPTATSNDKDSDSNNDANHDTLPLLRLDDIKQNVLSRHVHLWKPPYYGVRGAAQAVSDLAVSLLSSSSAEAADPKRTKTVVVQHLQTLQQRALQKLADKGKLLSQLNVKILVTGTQQQQQQLSWTEYPETWAANVVTKSQSENEEKEPPSSSTLVLVLQQPNPDLTIQQLDEDLTTMIHALYTENDKEKHDDKKKEHTKVEKRVATPRMIRFIHKGKRLPVETRLQELAHGGGTNAQAFLLCLIQQQQQQQQTSHMANAMTASTVAATPSTTTTATSNQSQQVQHLTEDVTLIASMRRAAHKLQSRLDITDAAGSFVALTKPERMAMLTALGLHLIGKQPDAEWQQLNETWQTRVDNYGLLQLDVAWLYLKLQCLDNLPDVVQRLSKAETSLRKQVHANFVTLALVQAETGNPVPALAAIFVRLFLLQGVAYHYFHRCDDEESLSRKSKERLDWAAALATSLRNVSPPNAVAQLCEALDATPTQVISAIVIISNLDNTDFQKTQNSQNTQKKRNDGS